MNKGFTFGNADIKSAQRALTLVDGARFWREFLQLIVWRFGLICVFEFTLKNLNYLEQNKNVVD